MKLFRAYKKTRFFLVVNILGLATGLAAAIMLILFVVNEYGYDRHFAGADRIVSLNTVLEDANVSTHYPISLRTAYTELPSRVPGIEAAVQIYNMREVEVRRETERTQGVKMFYADPEFFDVFGMTFVEGSAERALAAPGSIVITRPRAEAIFGGAAAAMGQSLVIRDVEYTVTAVVEPLPTNTHFTFDVLADMESMPGLQRMGGLEFFTFYLIGQGQSHDDVRAAIEREYTALLAPFREHIAGNIYGETERFTDIYLKGKAAMTLGKRNTMGFIRVLSALALAILAFAVANFVNLFSAQGETRMREIGVRKTYGAQPADLVRQLFSEVAVLVAVAFAVRRTKEIAIRRINGATRVEIFTLLSRDMLRWILAAGVVAAPVAWWLTTRFYLSTVENHTSLGWAVFVVPIVVQMAAALLVTSGVSIRVSSANPVESLKSE